jgi:hypothetical protein
MLHFTVADLDSRELASAWPLIRTAAPELGPDGWQSLGEALIQRGGGVIAVAAEGGGYLGVATYEPVDKPRSGRVLQVDRLVAFELTRRAPIRRILCEELEELAPQLGCTATVVSAASRSYAAQKQLHARQPRRRPSAPC